MGLASQASVPRTIGRYEIDSLIAEGSTSKVYKGRDTSTGTTVAVKHGDTIFTNDVVMLKRFEQEFRTTASLDHPNLVRSFEFGWDDSRPYIVMEYVDGDDLWTRIDRMGRLPEAEAVGYVAQIAQALHEAHKHGIIHRDIKPDNILVSKDGRAKLTDLGLSKDLESDTELTRPSRGIGTPNFIAPEQFTDAKHAGVRCDVYSLAATLFMALTGQVPFAATTLSNVLKKKLANDITPPRKLVPTLSEHVDWAVRRALMVDPDQRHATCLEFAAALSAETGRTGPSTAGNNPLPARRSGKKASTPEIERRSAVRYDCSLSSSCTIDQSLHDGAAENCAQYEAHVCDLSVTGIGLLLSRRFEPGSLLSVNLESGDGCVKRSREIRVVRVARAEGSRWFLAGKLSESLSKEELRLFL
jgi:serine/threonine protein kinase